MPPSRASKYPAQIQNAARRFYEISMHLTAVRTALISGILLAAPSVLAQTRPSASSLTPAIGLELSRTCESRNAGADHGRSRFHAVGSYTRCRCASDYPQPRFSVGLRAGSRRLESRTLSPCLSAALHRSRAAGIPRRSVEQTASRRGASRIQRPCPRCEPRDIISSTAQFCASLDPDGPRER